MVRRHHQRVMLIVVLWLCVLRRAAFALTETAHGAVFDGNTTVCKYYFCCCLEGREFVVSVVLVLVLVGLFCLFFPFLSDYRCGHGTREAFKSAHLFRGLSVFSAPIVIRVQTTAVILLQLYVCACDFTAGGFSNTAAALFGVIAGGSGNAAMGEFSTISGGDRNVATL